MTSSGPTSGHDHPTGEYPQVITAEPPVPGIHPNREYQPVGSSLVGVRGWLLLFCLQLTIFGPIWALGDLRSVTESYEKVSFVYPGWVLVTRLMLLLIVGMMAFSFFSGVLLWTRKGIAVQTAKRYLVFRLFGVVTINVLPFCAGLETSALEASTFEGVKAILQTVVYCTIWYLYLIRSKRVEQTYEEMATGGPWKYVGIVGACMASVVAVACFNTSRLSGPDHVAAVPNTVKEDGPKPTKFFSEPGRFSIEFPSGAPLPEQTEQTVGNGAQKVKLSIFAVQAPNRAYLVSFFDLNETKPSRQKQLEIVRNCTNGAVKNMAATVEEYEDIDFMNVYPAKRTFFSGTEGEKRFTARMEIVLVGGRIYQIMVLDSSGIHVKQKSGVDEFFKSFRLR